MKVSIILPISFNYIDAERSIVSCINQTYKNIELLVCLNGNTKKYNNNLIKKFKFYRKINFYVKDFNNIVDSLNFLTSKASGKYIARIDADDICTNDRIEKQVKLALKYNCDFISSNSKVISEKDKFEYDHKTNYKKKFFTNPVIHPSIFVKSKVLKQFKYKHIPFAEDYELYWRLEKSGIKFNNIKDNLVFYRFNKKNINNPVRSFFLTISTLIVSRAFREDLVVNENFFKIIKFNNKFKKDYKDYLNNYFYSTFINKIFFFVKSLFLPKNILKKLILNRLNYFFILNRKLKKIKINKNNEINKKPLVSIVIPTYNSEKTIYRTLKSIFNQTYHNIEIIIIDNSDNDETIKIIKKNFGNNKRLKIKKINHKILSGPARNLGVKYSNKKSRFVAFCDSDDTWKNNKLSSQISKMIKHNSNLSCTNYDFYNPNNKKVEKNYFKIPFLNINFSMIAWKNIIGTSSVVINKDLFKKVKGFPESKYFYSYEDYFLWLKLTKYENFLFVDKNLTIYRDDRKNSASKNSLSLLNQRMRIILYFILIFDFLSLYKIIIGNLELLNEFSLKKNKNFYEEYFGLL